MSTEQVQLSVANFKPGSFIIIENKKDHDFFFIIRSGHVKISSTRLSLTGETPPVLNPGDFFGVIGAMTGHVRNETAVSMDAVSLIAVKKAQFGFLIQKNTPLAMKIIRAFSRDLRRLNDELGKRTTKGVVADDNPENLFHNGEYYYNHDQPNLAGYIYFQYLRFHANGQFVVQAKERLESIPGLDTSKFAAREEFNRTYLDSEMIFSEFEPGHELFIIQGGKVKITKIVNDQEILLAVLNPGDIFGEMAILDNVPRGASAIAFGEVKVMAVSRANFEKVVIQNTTMATKLISTLSERLWTLYRQLGSLLFTDPTARLWDTLLTQLLKNHIAIEPKKHHHFTFGQKELMKMVGLEGPSGEQAMKKIISNRVFSIKNEKIYCEDIVEIQKEVDFALKMQQRDAKLEASKQQRRP